MREEYLKRTQLQKVQKETNKGFSLVEVLVCIALVTLICVPLFSGLRTSAILTNKAHYTQKVTERAQDELEKVKSMTVESYLERSADGSLDEAGVSYSLIESEAADSFGEYGEMYTRAEQIRAEFNSNVTLPAEEQKKLFSPFICEKDHIRIGSREYILRTKFMPAEYSQYNDRITAAGVNVSGYFDIAEADAVKFPVISDAVNLYDISCVDLLREKLEGIGETGKTDADILANMKKKVEITIKSSLGEGSMEVLCDVAYQYPADSPVAEITYNTYKATYDIAPTVEAAGGKKIGTDSGGYVFIMGSAYGSTFNNCINELYIVTEGDFTPDVYFILGQEPGSSSIYNYNSIQVNGAAYITNYNVKADEPGKMQIPGTDGVFHCNIKANGQVINDLDKYETVGKETYEAVIYAVEIDMYEREDRTKRVAHIEATKIDR